MSDSNRRLDADEINKRVGATEQAVDENRNRREAKRKKITENYRKITSSNNLETIASIVKISKEFEEPIPNQEAQNDKNAGSVEQKAEKKQKAESLLKKDIDRFVSAEARDVSANATDKILKDTEKAIRASFILSETIKDEDMTASVYAALDMRISGYVEEVSEYVAIMLGSQEGEISVKERRSFYDIFKEYIISLYISQKFKDMDDEILDGSEVVIDTKELLSTFYTYDGFLQLPLSYHKQAAQALLRSERVSGENKRAAELYLSQLEVISIVNQFPEDIFDVF